MNIKQEMTNHSGEDRIQQVIEKSSHRLQELESLRGVLSDNVIDEAISAGLTAHDLWMDVLNRAQAAEDRISRKTRLNQGRAMAQQLLGGDSDADV